MNILVIASTDSQLKECDRYLSFLQYEENCKLDIALVGKKIQKDKVEALSKRMPIVRCKYFFEQDNLGKIQLLINLLSFRFWVKKYYEIIIFSNYFSNRQRLLIARTKGKDLVSITDGTVIFSIAECRIHGKDPVGKRRSFFFHVKQIPHIRFFTSYQLSVAKQDALLIYALQQNRSDIQINDIHFIGSPLVNLNKLTIEQLLSFLSKIREQYPDQNIYYYVHPREEGESIEKIKKICPVVPYVKTYEETFHELNIVPHKIFTFYSSAAVSLMKIHPEVDFYFIDILDILRENSSESSYNKIRNVYDHIQSEKVSHHNIHILNFK